MATAAVAADSPSAGIDSDLARCAAIAAPAERVACYDALLCAGIAGTDERLACYDKLASRKASQPRAQQAASVSTSHADGKDEEKDFGLYKRRPEPETGPSVVQAQVKDVSVDRLGVVSVSLDNGQLWTFNDPDPNLKSGDAITIRRGALGSFLMSTPSRHTYRVRRAK